MSQNKTYYLNNTTLKQKASELCPGDIVYFSGTLYTARDAAHKRMTEQMQKGEALPFPLQDAIIYYAGPTQTPPNMAIGSCGPTTSSRMDGFAPDLMDAGVFATVGKGNRSKEVYNSIVRNKGLYLCAIGGAGAIMAKSVKTCEVIAYEDLGCESVKRLTTENMPLIVGIDCCGNTLFND